MEETLISNALAYAAQHRLQLAERLGFGIHGIIFAAQDKHVGGLTAIKAHRESEPYEREVSVYERLRDIGVSKIQGCNVPQLVRHDHRLRVIEMSIVVRPFVLDFAGAYLDALPDFPDEIWQEWEAEKSEQFDIRWPKVRAVLAALEEWDIYMVDVSPSNIALLE
jgi:hypothetical protein